MSVNEEMAIFVKCDNVGLTGSEPVIFDERQCLLIEKDNVC